MLFLRRIFFYFLNLKGVRVPLLASLFFLRVITRSCVVLPRWGLYVFSNISLKFTFKLSLRISESVPVRRTRNCDAKIRSWRTTEPALQYVLC